MATALEESTIPCEICKQQIDGNDWSNHIVCI